MPIAMFDNIDFCTDPHPWVEGKLASNYNLSTDISDYYLRCSPAKPSPFQAGLEVRSFPNYLHVHSDILNNGVVDRSAFRPSPDTGLRTPIGRRFIKDDSLFIIF